MSNATLSKEQREELLRTFKARFEKNMNRHKGHAWAKVHAKLEANAEKLWSLNEMERTGGEPDVVGHDKKTDGWPIQARFWLEWGTAGQSLPMGFIIFTLLSK